MRGGVWARDYRSGHRLIIIIIIILMTREARVAYKSIKYELCILKAECTNLANKFTTTVFFDVNK